MPWTPLGASPSVDHWTPQQVPVSSVVKASPKDALLGLENEQIPASGTSPHPFGGFYTRHEFSKLSAPAAHLRSFGAGVAGNDGVFPSRRAARREDPGVGDEPAPAQALICIWCRLCERLGELRGLSAPNAGPRALPCSKSWASRD